MSDQMIWKSYSSEDIRVKDEGGSQTVTGVVSDGSVDRDKDIVEPAGVDLKNFKKNPIVLFGHGRGTPPIGKAQWIRHDKDEDAIVAKTLFAKTDRAQEIFELMKDGFLKAFSIGFNPYAKGCDFGEPTEEEIKRCGRYKDASIVYRKVELLEFSVVPIPANPKALAFAVGKGMKMSEEMADLLSLDLSYRPPLQIRVKKKLEVKAKLKDPHVRGIRLQREYEKKMIEDAVKTKMGKLIIVPATS